MIPDEVVERVAMAIYLSTNGRLGGRWELVETKDVWRLAARAALSASGYVEMREALEKISKMKAQDSMRQECCGQAVVITSSSGEPIGQDCCGNPDLFGEWNDVARAALTIKRETGT